MQKTLFIFLIAYGGCDSTEGSTNLLPSINSLPASLVYHTIGSIPAPEGFVRVKSGNSSFGHWLRNIKLKKDNTVYLYNGKVKPNQSAQYAVADIPVGKKDLQQCADAVMRLRAEYLFDQKRFSEIVFSDNSGKKYSWKGGADPSSFPQYLERVFGMCGTASLEKQLKPLSVKNIKPGDVFIKGGFPGHAMIVADVARNKNGKTVYMLAQSYMPAQDIHIVKNPAIPGSPWFEVNEGTEVVTPEWTFLSSQLREW
ncbi:MAG TPA: DUF4846 domain-containing protein [Niabella sp.]|nr:DUF4846 domain-containing protein [Niabella sp.]